ncbi:MAG: rhodanese-like domain-containing protein, partial [Flavobacteriales bacterium]
QLLGQRQDRKAIADAIGMVGDNDERAFGQLDPKVPLLLYCHSGGRSEQALEYLVSKGYRARHLQGGIIAWRKAGLPVVK